MYVPRHHRAPNSKSVVDYICRNPFATLVGLVENRQVAAHIPMHLDKTMNYLYSHVARGNQISNCFDGNQLLLAIFMSTHAYVSSSWYDHVNVPTWNYIAVHISGSCQVVDGDELESAMEALVEEHENQRPGRFQIDHLSDREKKVHFNGLIGFKMKVEHIEAAFKLSQNRNEHDYAEIIRQLELIGDPLSIKVADQMKKRTL